MDKTKKQRYRTARERYNQVMEILGYAKKTGCTIKQAQIHCKIESASYITDFLKKADKFCTPQEIQIIKELNEGLKQHSASKSQKEFSKLISLDIKPLTKLKPYEGGNPNNVLVISDTHFPFERDGALEHCREMQERFKCGTVVHIGDVIDNHFSSYHETNPDGKSAGDELEVAKQKVQDWYKVFPKAKVCLGNHDQLIQRKAFTSGLSKHWIRGYAEVLETPGWQFELEHMINGILYIHGTGTRGAAGALSTAMNRRVSVVQGHLHSTARIDWNVSSEDRLFAMNVGCLVDDRKYAFDYAMVNPKKFIVSCGVVIAGELPIILPMQL